MIIFKNRIYFTNPFDRKKIIIYKKKENYNDQFKKEVNDFIFGKTNNFCKLEDALTILKINKIN